ncbi:MAG: GNAT family N-acetyltransferase [Thermoplasmata archaeon]|jgi:GNAT superfamily N-acetyltransferase
MAADLTELATEAALEGERQFVLTLGGFALEMAGATLVTHEKLPVPRFNFVQELGVGRERQTAFFERALDHYFQRALRPTFRVPLPAPDHVDAGLRRFGFRPRPAPLVLMLSTGEVPAASKGSVEVRVAVPAEVDLVTSFWVAERARAEFRSALEVAWVHPNPHERLVPLFASLSGRVVASAILYRYRFSVGIHAVATTPSARGQGAASDLVSFALREDPLGSGVRYSIFADSPRLQARLEKLGFRAARAFQEYELPAGAQLALPPPGPPTPPRWRPRARDPGPPV